jgi:hypothetical protein
MNHKYPLGTKLRHKITKNIYVVTYQFSNWGSGPDNRYYKLFCKYLENSPDESETQLDRDFDILYFNYDKLWLVLNE